MKTVCITGHRPAKLPWGYKTNGTEYMKMQIVRYNNIIAHADKITLVNDHYFSYCMLARNKYMVDCSDIVLAVWNGGKKGGTWQTIKYANSKNKKIDIIHID